MTTLGTFHSTTEIEHSVLNVLRSGRLSYGPVSKEYEKKFADLHQCSQGISTNSGTSSLVVIIQAMKELYGWDDGDEIIVPSTTFVATVNAVLHCNLTPVLVDVEKDLYCIDVWLIEEKITDRTRAIIPVHAFGMPADMPMVAEIANSHNLKVIEDSCECMYVEFNGLSVGAWGDAAAFSTYAAHILVTGVGGMCTVRNNPELAVKIRSLVNHGIDIQDLPSGDVYEQSFLGRRFRFNSIGHSFRVTEIESAIGIEGLRNFYDVLSARQSNARMLSQLLSNVEELQLPSERMGTESSWMVYPVVVKNGSKHPLMIHLRKNGIESRDLLPLTNQPCYDFIDPAAYPVSQWLNHSGLYIGCHQDITEEEIIYTSEVIKNFYE